MFYSQYGQDQYLEEHVFRGYKQGTFVDIGAHDGLSLNNTLYFEKYHGWTGINVEPIRAIYDQLQINRPHSININCAVCNHDGETEFLCNTGYTEMLSGIKSTYDPRHYHRLQIENKNNNATTEVMMVKTKRLETIFDEYGLSHIHYLSIDVEGAEFEVIRSIHFDKVFIDVIGFENNYNDSSDPIIRYLVDKNYVVIRVSTDIFMIHRDSVFYKRMS